MVEFKYRAELTSNVTDFKVFICDAVSFLFLRSLNRSSGQSSSDLPVYLGGVLSLCWRIERAASFSPLSYNERRPERGDDSAPWTGHAPRAQTEKLEGRYSREVAKAISIACILTPVICVCEKVVREKDNRFTLHPHNLVWQQHASRTNQQLCSFCDEVDKCARDFSPPAKDRSPADPRWWRPSASWSRWQPPPAFGVKTHTNNNGTKYIHKENINHSVITIRSFKQVEDFRELSCFSQCNKKVHPHRLVRFSFLYSVDREMKVRKASAFKDHNPSIRLRKEPNTSQNSTDFYFSCTWRARHFGIRAHATTDVLEIQHRGRVVEEVCTCNSTARRGMEEARTHRPLPSGSSSGASIPKLHSPT